MLTAALCLIQLKQVTFVRFLAAGRQVLVAYGLPTSAGASSGNVEIWDVRSGKRIQRISSNVDVSRMEMATDGKTFAIGGRDGAPVEIRKTDTGALVRRFDSGLESYPSYAIGRDGTKVALIASARLTEYGDIEAKICPLPEGEAQTIPESRGATILAWDPTGNRLAMSVAEFIDPIRLGMRRFNSLVQVYDAGLTKVEHRIDLGQGMAVSGMSFSPSGQLAVRLRNGRIDLWNSTSWKVSQSFESQPSPEGPQVETSSFAFSKTGQGMALLIDQIGVSFFDIGSTRKTMTIYAKNWELWKSMDLSPDGATLAIATTNGTIQLRKSRTGALIKTIHVSDGQ